MELRIVSFMLTHKDDEMVPVTERRGEGGAEFEAHSSSAGDE